MNNSELANKARGVAATLTYNDEPQSQAKHLLLEMAHRLDSMNTKVHRKREGLLLVNGLGKCRFATWKEIILYKIFDVVPKV